MSLTDVSPGEVQVPLGRHGHGAGALTAGIRSFFAALSGLLLTSGIGVVLWAVTPSSVGGPQQSLRAAVAAFAAGNAMTVSIGRAALTLPPLMITVVAVGLLAGVAGRGSTGSAGAGSDDGTGELTRTAAAAAVYAAVVTTAGVVLGTPGAIAAEQWWRPFLLALVVVGASVFLRGQAWRSAVLARTPQWCPVAVRLGGAGVAGVLAAGAAAVVIGLVSSFVDVGTVQTLAAPGPAAGFGMVMLGVAYLPNAVLAGAGYATGVGFHIGGGTYSPFGSSPVELPAVSLLAAAPDGREASRVGMVLLLVPVVVALLIGRAAVKRLGSRRERLLAVGTGAVLAGLTIAVLAAVAGGGITGGQWATIGAPPLLLGMVVAAILGVVGCAVTGLARQSTLMVPGDAGDAGDAGGHEAVNDRSAAGDDVVADDAAAIPAAGAATGDDALPADGADRHEADDVAGEPLSGAAVAADAVAADSRAEEVGSADAGPADAGSADAGSADAGPADAGPADAGPADAGPADSRADEADLARSAAADQAPLAEAKSDPAADDALEVESTHGETPGPATDELVGAPAVDSTSVPLARREEDMLADSVAPSDADVVDQLTPRSEPRRVG